MTQREVTDNENTAWTCVQAYAGIQEKLPDGDALVKNGNSTVTVVCTPSGGAQTVRLELAPDWAESVSDEELVSAISTAK